MNPLQTIVRPLLSWYGDRARSLPWRSNPSPYNVWISEIMLQQTRVEAVRSYFERFITALPDIPSLASASEDTLLKLWEGLGYYSRARNLRKAAIIVCNQFGGKLPASYESLLTLPGIGPYTAGAIASIAFGLPHPAVDGNVLRVASRYTASYDSISDTATKQQVEKSILEILPARRPGDFNQALMDLGATICLPNASPKCTDCPVSAECEGYFQGIAEELPVKKEKKPRKIEQKTFFVIQCKSTLALCRFDSTGLLAGLWGLPSRDGAVLLPEISGILANWGFTYFKCTPLPPAKHIFTHIEWHMTGYLVDIPSIPPDSSFIWASPAGLSDIYALPTAMRPFKNAFLQAVK